MSEMSRISSGHPRTIVKGSMIMAAESYYLVLARDFISGGCNRSMYGIFLLEVPTLIQYESPCSPYACMFVLLNLFNFQADQMILIYVV